MVFETIVLPVPRPKSCLFGRLASPKDKAILSAFLTVLKRCTPAFAGVSPANYFHSIILVITPMWAKGWESFLTLSILPVSFISFGIKQLFLKKNVMTQVQTITIEKKRFTILPEEEYVAILQDIADLKKVIKRRNEPGIEADIFFRKLADKRKANKQ